MSFLNSVLSSIETGKPSTPAPVAPKPVSSSAATRTPPPRSDIRKNVGPTGASSNARTSTSISNSSSASSLNKNLPDRAAQVTGQKRKADDGTRQPDDRLQKRRTPDSLPTSRPVPSMSASIKNRGAVAPRPVSTPKLSSLAPSSAAPKSGSVTPTAAAPSKPSKPPPKGSFAEIMAKAKALQEKAPGKVGVIRHQSAPKEKLSKMERKRLALEAKSKEREGGKPSKQSGTPQSKPVGGKHREEILKRRETEANSYKGTARPTAQRSATPEYKGTAGLPPKRSGSGQDRGRRQPRRDEYLGTDEEDEGDDFDNYYSDESDDMEAGAFDVEEEEQLALRAARKEDEEEQRLEENLKREKLERKKKLAALAARQRR